MIIDRFPVIVFGCFLAVLGASFIDAPFLEHQFLQHFSTVVGLCTFIYFDRKKTFSRKSFVMFMAFLSLHVLAARYVYSYVPYDQWTEKLFGFSITNTFHFTRNHFDRLVHFCFGLLITYPATEVFRKFTTSSKRFSLLSGVMFILAISALYEIGEWCVAIGLSPTDAEAYNGQQGDMFDAPKDMAMAFCGSVLFLLFVWIQPARRKK
jgi:putative membrane protein